MDNNAVYLHTADYIGVRRIKIYNIKPFNATYMFNSFTISYKSEDTRNNRWLDGSQFIDAYKDNKTYFVIGGKQYNLFTTNDLIVIRGYLETIMALEQLD